MRKVEDFIKRNKLSVAVNVENDTYAKGYVSKPIFKWDTDKKELKNCKL